MRSQNAKGQTGQRSSFRLRNPLLEFLAQRDLSVLNQRQQAEGSMRLRKGSEIEDRVKLCCSAIRLKDSECGVMGDLAVAGDQQNSRRIDSFLMSGLNQGIRQ